MADCVSPLESRRKRKRKRPYNDPLNFDSDTDDSFLQSKPRKKPKTNHSKPDVDLCSTDSENNNASSHRDPLQSISHKNTQNTQNTRKTKKKKKKKKRKKDKPSSNMNECIICNKSLRELSPTRQQLHINSCLDVKEHEKNYSYSIHYRCPICAMDLTVYDEETRSKHIKQCLPDARQNADDAEFETNPLQKLEDELKRKKKADENAIVTTELKSIFERKFVCFMCDKALNRCKLNGRCKHLKQCAKKSGKDVYAVCGLIGIQRDIIDNPHKYEDKFNNCYYKDQKKQSHKQQKKADVDMDIDELSVFAFNKEGNGEPMLLQNNTIKQKKGDIECEWNGFIQRMTKKKKKIGLNRYDEYITDILNDLSETNAMIQKMEKVRQILEIKLQRTQALKKQHEDLQRAEQESILESVSPTKDGAEELDFKSQTAQDVELNHNSNSLQFSLVDSLPSSQRMSIEPVRLRRSSVDRHNADLLASQHRNPKRKKRNLWSIAQETHKVSPSQFRVPCLLKGTVTDIPSNSTSVSGSAMNTTQCLLDGLMNDSDDNTLNNTNNIQNNLVSQFFNEANSEYMDSQSPLNITILDEDPQLVLKSDHDASEPDDGNATFPMDLPLSINESFFNSNAHNKNNEIIHNEHSMQSNNGSLFEVDNSRQTADEMEGELNLSPHSTDANVCEGDDIFNNAFEMEHELDLRLSMSPVPHGSNGSPHDQWTADQGEVITPIVSRQRKGNRLLLPETPMHEIPITPMIGAEKVKALKALNLYFETPEAERRRLPQPVRLPPDIPGRQSYLDNVNTMSLDALKAEMNKYGLKCGSKLMMRRRLEMTWDALHPNSPMIRVLNKHMDKEESVEQENKKEAKNKKKTSTEIELDMINAIAKDDELFLKISTFSAVRFEEIAELMKRNEIKISKMNLQKFMDAQGISFVLPEDPNAVKGPRRVRRRKRK
eukprot:662890_1